MDVANSKAHADPTKDFFVDMITRDIGLEDCIFDLIDNSIDGAKRFVEATASQDKYKNYEVNITFKDGYFEISDNCGGISLDDAVNYAFHFGRRRDSPQTPDRSIGLYGIGMKRAIFKIGKNIQIESVPGPEAFCLSINVDEWRRQEGWDFDINDLEARDTLGTLIRIEEINLAVNNVFTDLTFAERISKEIGLYYAFIISEGYSINVNGVPVSPFVYAFKSSNEFQPINFDYCDDEVKVSILCGLAGSIPDDSEEEKKESAKRWGWYVLCNERVVLAADKSTTTGWGINHLPGWHGQYNGFMGVVSFESNDPALLPWTTTKRELDLTSGVYLRARSRMIEGNRAFIDYTNARKVAIGRAKELEDKAEMVSIQRLEKREKMILPQISDSQRKRVRVTSIQYQRPTDIVKKAKAALGNSTMSNTQVGIQTFNYFLENEVEE